MKSAYLIALSSLFFKATPFWAQEFLLDGTPIVVCSGRFVDAGGVGGNYPDNQKVYTTLCSDNVGSTQVLLRFDTLAIAPGDTLCLLDGNTPSSPVIACYTDFTSTQPILAVASANNLSGCLGVVFVSDTQGNAAGWSASIQCAPCVLPAPANVQVVQMRNGAMHWRWDEVVGSAGFEVSVNGSPWQPSSEPLGHVVDGLSPGEVVILEVRPVSGNPNCSVLSFSANKAYVECTLQLTLVSTSDARCAGTPSGSAAVAANNAIGPVQFFIAGNPMAFSAGVFDQVFAAGAYAIAARDSVGCRDTVSFAIGEPPPLEVQATATDARCFADNSGAVSASASGGVGSLTFRWQRCSGGTVYNSAQVVDLFAGCYALTVQDANGCTVVVQDTVGEPPPFSFTSSQDSVRCYGGADGRASIAASGATPPYSYRWSNGDVGTAADSLKAGFHSVTVTDSAGCQAVTLVQVHQPPLLQIDSLRSVEVRCFGDSNGAVVARAVGGCPPFSFLWNNQGSGAALDNLTAGTYTVTVTDRNGCTVSGSVSVGSPAALMAQIAVQGERCVGACDGSAALTLSGGTPPLSVTWLTSGIPPGQTKVEGLCPGIYRFVLSDDRSCVVEDSFAVPAAVPLAVSLLSTAPACAGENSGAVFANISGGMPPYQFLWSNGHSDNPMTGVPCGTYGLMVSDSLGCTQTAVADVPCPEALVVDSLVAVPAHCPGNADGTATVFARGGAGVLSYQWSDPNQQISATAVNLLAGVYTVTVSDANGCSATASGTVEQPPAWQAVLFAKPVTCAGGNDGAAWAVVSGGSPPYAYLWSSGGTDSVATSLSAGPYQLTISDAQGCTWVPPSVLVEQPATLLQVTTTVVQRACFNGGGGQVRAEATGGSGPPFSYRWSNQATSAELTDVSAGVFAVTVSDAAGCTAVQSVTVDRWDSIAVSIVAILPSCPEERDGQASVNKLEGGAGNGVRQNYVLQWNIPGVGDTIYLNGLSSGQRLSLTVTDNAGCTAVFERHIDSLPPIRPILRVDSIRCFGQRDGAAYVVDVQSTRPIAFFRWSTLAAGTKIEQLGPGVYTVTATDMQGCTGTASVTVDEPPPLGGVLRVQNLLCAEDRNGRLHLIPSGGVPPYTFLWNTGATSDLLENLGPGSYTVTLTDQKGCTYVAAAVVQAPPPLKVDVRITAPTCFGYLNGRAELFVQGGQPPFRYGLNGNPLGGSPTFPALKAGQYMARVVDGNGCQAEVGFEVSQPLPVQVTLTPDSSIAFGDTLLLTADVFNAVGDAALSWSSGLSNAFSCADPPECASIWAYPAHTTLYTATAVDANGCSGSSSMRVHVDKPRGVYVPLAFSPNGDGQNDRLVVHGSPRHIQNVRLFRVFDRWGALVFEQYDWLPNDEARGWDGSFRGQPAQVGTYTWYAEVRYRDGYEERMHGNVLLVR